MNWRITFFDIFCKLPEPKNVKSVENNAPETRIVPKKPSHLIFHPSATNKYRHLRYGKQNLNTNDRQFWNKLCSYFIWGFKAIAYCSLHKRDKCANEQIPSWSYATLAMSRLLCVRIPMYNSFLKKMDHSWLFRFYFVVSWSMTDETGVSIIRFHEFKHPL